jgi:hypothetical protein
VVIALVIIAGLDGINAGDRRDFDAEICFSLIFPSRYRRAPANLLPSVDTLGSFLDFFEKEI